MLLLSVGLFLFLSLPRQGLTLSQLEGFCGTTPIDFKSKFHQYCMKHTRMKHTSSTNCTIAWDAFLGAFAGRNASQVKQKNYNPYFNIITIEASVNQSLFWSGTIELVKILSSMDELGVNVVSSVNTPSSKIIFNSGDCWCSAEGNDDLEYTIKCPNSTQSHFWAQFSTRFAQAARGTIFFLADALRKPVYNPLSFFGCYELVNLDTTVVKRVIALNVHLGRQGEKCGEGSLDTLRMNVTARNMLFTCYDIISMIDTNQTSECIGEVVTDVQKGTETKERQIMCSGAKFFQVSIMILLVTLLVSMIMV